ncbi:MAG TPA: DUF4350 domain-containing protein [Frankiaceae bacterium]|nr:DUF4350 domain-containing protein [Frankiaceae bacterium]
MTAVLDTPAEEEADARSALATVEPREAWRKARLPLALGLALVLVALLHAVTAGGSTVGRMDPDSATDEGAMALATLLRDRGIEVAVVDEPTGAPDTTVFVPEPVRANMMRPGALSSARISRALVVVAPGDPELEMLDVDAGVAERIDVEPIDPGCDHPDAVAAGKARLGGVTFGAPEYAVPCYVSGGLASFVELAEGARRVTLLGTPAFMTNEHLDDDGNAALALRLLTRHPRVEWVYPREPEFGAADGEEKALVELLPHRVIVATAQVFVVLLLLALWRGRRLGPVVVEPLPVVVRAAEAVEGRARLYEGSHARDQAANALRAGLRDRLVRVLGLAPDATPETMVAAITARTGREAVAVGDLLYGRQPADDAALVRLAADLDRLDNEVRAL